MKGSAKWYLRCTVRTFLIVAAWSVVMWLFASKAWVSVGEDGREMWEIIYYMLIGYIIFVFSVTLSFYRRDIPLAISMGVSRKNAFCGTVFYTGMNIAAVLILTVAAVLLMDEGEIMGRCMVWAALFIIYASIFGTVFGIINQVFGKTAAIICGVVIYILFVAGFAFVGVRVKRGMMVNMLENSGVLAIAAVVTALIWCSVLIVHYRTVKKIAV